MADQPKQADKAKEFVDKYDALCKEMGYRIYPTPVWLARDDGTFSMQIQLSVGQLPKQQD